MNFWSRGTIFLAAATRQLDWIQHGDDRNSSALGGRHDVRGISLARFIWRWLDSGQTIMVKRLYAESNQSSIGSGWNARFIMPGMNIARNAAHRKFRGCAHLPRLDQFILEYGAFENSLLVTVADTTIASPGATQLCHLTPSITGSGLAE